MCELESFVALQYVRGFTFFVFFTRKLTDILIFSENMSHVRSTAILKYLSFLGKKQTDSQQYGLFPRH